GVHGEEASDDDALQLTARERDRVARGEGNDLQPLERVVDVPGDFVSRPAEIRRSERDLVPYGEGHAGQLRPGRGEDDAAARPPPHGSREPAAARAAYAVPPARGRAPPVRGSARPPRGAPTGRAAGRAHAARGAGSRRCRGGTARGSSVPRRSGALAP